MNDKYGNAPLLLDKNENPFELPSTLRKELVTLVENMDIRHYPNPFYSALRERLGDFYGIAPECIMVGNGGDEVLSILFSTFVQAKDRVIYPNPAFSQYHHFSGVFHLEPQTFGFDIEENRFIPRKEDFFRLLKASSPKLVIVDTPNNPTGTVFSAEILVEAASLTSAPFLVDQAYIDFCDHRDPLLECWKKGELPENMVFLRTFSKAWGMAGLRLGFVIGNKDMIDQLNAVRGPFNVNVFTEQVGMIMLNYRDEVEEQVTRLRQVRENFVKRVNTLPQWQAFESQGNFVLARTEHSQATIAAFLEARNIHLRFLDNLPWEGTWARITLGLEDHMERLLQAMQDFA